MNKEDYSDLNNKQKRILSSLIEHYISQSEPVGSKTISQSYIYDLSPASIRNYMEEMEKLGYIYKPHPSAGRIPTEKGYRFYISELLKRLEDRDRELDFLKRKFDELNNNLTDFLKYLTNYIADFTKKTAIVILPKIDTKKPKTMDFVKIGERKVLVVTVYDYAVVENRIIDTKEDIEQELLIKFSNFINDKLSKRISLDEIRESVLLEMKTLKELFDKTFQTIQQNIEEHLLLIDGQDYMLDMPEFSQIEHLKKIFKAFKEKAKFAEIITRSIDRSDIKVFIGGELSLDINNVALILSPYSSADNLRGAIGVFGPMRMDYYNLIPFLFSTSKFMNEIMKG
ncbi:MAG: heat-inducible transcriptional repressor HrcA [Proteobacteria bacterium]|nr:heat-inducible transcriptional repressor HrcA [Pseudomonadota bacterium]